VSSTITPLFIKKWTANLNSTDRLMIAFWSILAALSAILHSKIPLWPLILSADLIAILLVCALAYIANSTHSNTLRWIHDWAALPLVVFTYKQLYFIIAPIHQGKDYDRLLISVDQWLCGVNPTEWLVRLSNPFLTETLQISYSLFYVLFIAAGLELYLKKEYPRWRYFRFTIVYGFFISYLAYFLFPAVGPRFTLHDFSKIDTELPGFWVTPALRWFVNIFESIHGGMSNSLAMASAQRDVFPSGHTMLTLAAIVLSWRYRLKVRPYILIIGILLIFATVYLRYHYLIDILAGALLAIPCLLTSGRICALLKDSDGS
jgi:membrane-associated phospholipid phosphatase